jgi:hypothetical protein
MMGTQDTAVLSPNAAAVERDNMTWSSLLDEENNCQGSDMYVTRGRH